MAFREFLRSSLLVASIALTLAQEARADPPPPDDSSTPSPEPKDVRSAAIDAYQVKRGFLPRVEAAAAVRRRILTSPPGLMFAPSIVKKSAVEGTVEVPVIPLLFANTGTPPYSTADLQAELFTGPWPTGTMSDDYREMSGGKLIVRGEVFDWTKVSRDDSFYAGPPGSPASQPCNGLCLDAHTGELLVEALQKVDTKVDFRRFDNDGPDGLPNSGDDDGYVDFVAFVQPEVGGECWNNDNIWSHSFSLERWGGDAFKTNDPGKLGPTILVDEYVIMPALACDKTTMIQIGVFSHEFGHAFGLPDLYDTRRDAESAGMGGWDLMAYGSWGGEGADHPELPSHMSAWSKEYLGWIRPRVIEEDRKDVTLAPVHSGDAIKIDYTDAADPADQKYLLLEYRTQDGFDKSIAASGLLVSEINNVKVSGELPNNAVNNSPFDMGVNVIEADGERKLDRNDSRGDDGDVFPGAKSKTAVDGTHAEHISAALCNIKQTAESIKFDVYVSRTTCPGALPEAAAISPQQAISDKLRGEELLIEGVLTNQGSNYFSDRKLVVTGQGGADSGGEIIVTLPAPLEMAAPSNGNVPDANTLSGLLNKNVILRGKLERKLQKGLGLTDVFVVDEVQPAQ